MNKFKLIIVFLIIIIFTSVLTGCWDRRDFDRFTLVKGIAVDKAKEEDRVKLSVQLITPTIAGQNNQQGQSTQQTTSVVSSTGFSLFEANRNLIKQTGKKAFYGHNEIIIFGEEIAREGIAPYLDYFIREPRIRGRNMILIAKGEAEKILKAPHVTDAVSATGIKAMVNGISVTGQMVSMDLMTFLRRLFNDNTELIASAIELRKDGPGSEQNNMGGNSKNQKEKSDLLFAEGGALFKGDKLVDWLNRKEARGTNWVIKGGEIRGPVLVYPPGEPKKNKIAIQVNRHSTQIKPFRESEKFKIKIKVETEGVIVESMARKYDITTDEHLQVLNKRFAQVVKNEINSALNKARKYGSDIFGFGEIIYRKYPEEFMKIKDRWSEEFKKLPVTIEVKADIRRIGAFNEGTGVQRQ